MEKRLSEDPSNHKFGRPIEDFLVQERFFETDQEVEEDRWRYVIRICTPAFEPKDLSLELQEDVLILRAFKRINRAGWWRKSIRQQIYQRSFCCPPDILLNRITASFELSILEVSLPKSSVGDRLAQSYRPSYEYIRIRNAGRLGVIDRIARLFSLLTK